MKELLQYLGEPFEPGEVDFKVQSTSKDGKKGLIVAYIDARTVQSRLDGAVQEGLIQDWRAEYHILEKGENGYVVECTLSLLLPEGRSTERKDVGEGDSLKAAYSDALKRAAVQFGVARYLYSLEKHWVNLAEGGRIPEEELKRLRSKLPRPGKPKEAREEESLEARLKRADETIARLVGELKAEGLGAEATKVLLSLGYKVGEPGTGEEDLERARKVYRALEALRKK